MLARGDQEALANFRRSGYGVGSGMNGLVGLSTRSNVKRVSLRYGKGMRVSLRVPQRR